MRVSRQKAECLHMGKQGTAKRDADAREEAEASRGTQISGINSATDGRIGEIGSYMKQGRLGSLVYDKLLR